MKVNIFVIIRILVGLVFVISGAEKLIGPYQNFLYVVQGYELLPSAFEEIVARVFPWIELLLGVFVCLGLWLRPALRGVIMMIITFLIVVSQALIRQLPISDCGCFGELAAFPLPVVAGIDSVLLALTVTLLIKYKKAIQFSLDQCFDK